jgi:TfoX/Sxy family transcriptional regulator of competence genes
MAYDEAHAQRFRDALRGVKGVSEKPMMGGLCLLVNGNMLGGVDRTKGGTGRFMFRVGKQNESKALARPGASAVEMGGRRIGGFVFVEAEACTPRALTDWIALALGYVQTLPGK